METCAKLCKCHPQPIKLESFLAVRWDNRTKRSNAGLLRFGYRRELSKDRW